MLIIHDGHEPTIHPTAWIAPNAIISGDVTVGARSRVLWGAVLTAESRASLTIGAECVVMEQAVLRASGQFNLRLGDRVLVGPHAYLTGCEIESHSFLATGTMVFNDARLGVGCVVALGGKVHIRSELPAGTWVPIGHIAYGQPAIIYPPNQAQEVHTLINKDGGFLHYVFGVSAEDDRLAMMDAAMPKYSRMLERHQGDQIIES